MGKLSKHNRRNIEAIFEQKTGVKVRKGKGNFSRIGIGSVALAGALLCVAFVATLVKSRPDGDSVAGKPKETVRVDMVEHSNEEETKEVLVHSIASKFENWTWPTVSTKISTSFGVQRNGMHSDHINIAGKEGDAIYAATDGVVYETGYQSTYGYYIILDVGEQTTVKYGHLKEVYVKQGESVAQGQTIATMGKTGMATGPNLSYAVYINGEAVNPLAD